MPEPEVNRYSNYAGKLADEASKVLYDLPTESQLAWIKVQPELLKDPVGHPRIRSMASRSGKLFLFTQSNPPLEVLYEVDNEEGNVYFMHFSAPQLQEKSRKVVVVYSEQDQKWFALVEQYALRPLQDGGLIEFWDVSKIAPGANIHVETLEAFESARMALLLVSMDLISPDPQDDQIRLADLLEAHGDRLEIQWVAVRSSIYKNTAIGPYEPINDPKKPLFKLEGANREEALVEIYNEIERIVKEW